MIIDKNYVANVLDMKCGICGETVFELGSETRAYMHKHKNHEIKSYIRQIDYGDVALVFIDVKLFEENSRVTFNYYRVTNSLHLSITGDIYSKQKLRNFKLKGNIEHYLDLAVNFQFDKILEKEESIALLQ